MSTKQPDNISFVPINRKFFDHPFWREERTFSKAEAWLFLLQAARFEDSKATELIGGQLVSWTRGQLPASLRYLGDKWKWDKNKVDRFLQLLEKERMITRSQCSGQTIIELTNYEKYRPKGHKSGQGAGQSKPPQESIPANEQDSERDTQRDSGGTGSGQPRDNTKKEKKVNKDEEIRESGAGAPPPPPVEKLELINPFSEEFLKDWERWKKYKKTQFGFKYKALDTEQTGINELYENSDGNEDVARRIINKSIARCWQGLFRLKKEDYEGLQQNSAGRGAEANSGPAMVYDRP